MAPSLHRRRAAIDKLHNPAARRDGDAVGDVAPGAVELPARDVVLLRHGAYLAAPGMRDMPHDLDVLLVRLRRDGDLGVDIEVRLAGLLIDDVDIGVRFSTAVDRGR